MSDESCLSATGCISEAEIIIADVATRLQQGSQRGDIGHADRLTSAALSYARQLLRSAKAEMIRERERQEADE